MTGTADPPAVAHSRGLFDVLPSIAAALGVPGHSNTLALPESPRYALVLVDGLGLRLIEQHHEFAPFLSRLHSVRGVSSAIPSTTSVNLTSLGTGLKPGLHGMPGYSCRIPGTNKVLNTLRWDESIDPLMWQRHETVYEKIANDGVHTVVLNKADFEHSGLTRCSQRGVPYVPVEQAWERNIAMAHESAHAERSFTFGYESDLDFAGHAHGVDSPEWRQTLERIDTDLAELRRMLPEDTNLIITADHGMIDLDLDDRFDLVNHPELLDDVVVVAGEARFRHLHTRAGAEVEVAARWRAFLGDRAEIRLREETHDWFGALDPQVAARFGDVIVAAQGDFGIFHSEYFAIEMLMTGFHGSVTDVETAVPVLLAT